MNDLIKKIEQRFVSLNSVPCSDIRLTRDEWNLIRHSLANRIQSEGIAPPDGRRLVPVVPTKRMLMCFKHEWITNQANECYEMLLAVAPKPEVK